MKITMLKYSLYKNEFYFVSCSIWNWEEGVRMNYIVNNNPKVSRITSMGFLNAHDLTLLLTGTGKNQNYPLHRGVTFFLCWDTCKWMRTNWRGRLENHLASFARQFQFNTESTKVVSQITRLKLYFKNGVGKLKLWERLQRPWLDLSYCSFSTATVTWTSFYICPPLKIFAICLNFIHCFGVVEFFFFFVLIFSFYVWFLFFFFIFFPPPLFSDDGSVRVWRNLEGENYSDKSLEIVTAWQALSGMLPSTRGMGKELLDTVIRGT